MSNRLTIPNGFAPIISPDGQTIACGFNQVLSVALPSGVVTTIQADDASPCGFHNGLICESRYVTLAPNVYGRTLVLGPMTPPPNQSPGYNPHEAVVNGHVFSSAGGRHYIDGVAMPYPGGAPVDVIEHVSRGAEFWIHKEQEIDPNPLIVRALDGSRLSRIDLAVTGARVFDAGHPTVSGNIGNQGTIFHADGTVFHQFQRGEFCGCVVDGPTEPWALTYGQFTDGVPFICARPFSDLSGPGIIRRGMWWKGLQARLKPDGTWVWAGYYDGVNPANGLTNALDIDSDVDPNEPRELLDLSNSQPGTPIPPTPVPPVEPPPGAQVIQVTLKAGQSLFVHVTAENRILP